MNLKGMTGIKERILLVDDERAVVESLKELLMLEGFYVDTADSGEQGIALLESARSNHRFYDLVLTDLVMPPLDGMKVLEKAHDIDPEVVVILMTGYATIESAVHAIRNGAYEYLLKPFLIPDLMLTIERGLEKRRLFKENRRLISDLKDKNTELIDALDKLKKTQNQLIQMAQKHAVSETVSNLKHEIINPMTSILARVQLILEQDHPDSSEDFINCLEIIQSQTVRVSKIVANLDQRVQTPMLNLQEVEHVLTDFSLDGS